MSILVTGGAGYIGSHTVARLVAAGHDVVVYDDLSAGSPGAVSPTVPLIRARVQDTERLQQALSDHHVTAVFHFAARADVPESVAMPAPYFDANVAGGVSLLNAMTSCGVKRLVFSSSASVYGNPERTPIREDDPLHPTHPYGLSKLMVEQMLPAYEQAYGVRAVSLRYFCAAGAEGGLGEHHVPERHLIPRVLDVALGIASHVEICGTDYPTPDGTGVRDFVHVADVAGAHLAALAYLRGGGTGTAVNVGTGRGWSVREVVEAARKVTGHPLPTRDVSRRPGDPPTLVADVAKIYDMLGWRARFTDIHDTIESAWAHVLAEDASSLPSTAP